MLFFYSPFVQIWSSERGQVVVVGSWHAGAGEVQQRCSGTALRVGQGLSGLRETPVQIGRWNMVRFFYILCYNLRMEITAYMLFPSDKVLFVICDKILKKSVWTKYFLYIIIRYLLYNIKYKYNTFLKFDYKSTNITI